MLICYCCFYSVKCSFEISVTKAIFERFSEWGTMSDWVFTVIGKINFCLECLNKVKVLFYVDPFATVFICYGKVLYTLCLVQCHLALKFILVAVKLIVAKLHTYILCNASSFSFFIGTLPYIIYILLFPNSFPPPPLKFLLHSASWACKNVRSKETF